MSKEEIEDFLLNTYNDRIKFEIYIRDAKKHIRGKISFGKGKFGFGLDLISDGKTKEQIKEWIDRAILDAFLLG